MSSNPYAPPTAPPVTGANSDQVHRIVNAVFILGGALLGALITLTEGLKLLGFYHPHSSLHLSPPTNAGDSFVAGAVVGRALSLGWSLVAFVGGPILAYGLLAKRPWAAQWARNYWLLSLFSCYFTLPAIYGLLSTTRPTFRQIFDERR